MGYYEPGLKRKILFSDSDLIFSPKIDLPSLGSQNLRIYYKIERVKFVWIKKCGLASLSSTTFCLTNSGGKRPLPTYFMEIPASPRPR